MQESILLFERKEKKYLLTEEKYIALCEKLKEHTTEDIYGQYTVCNTYFDTDDYSLIRKSLEAPYFKEKLRLRSYGIPKSEQLVFLEIKKKYKGVVYKRRIQIDYNSAVNYLQNGIIPKLSPKELSTFKEIDYFYKTNNLKPKVYLAYDRMALISNENKDFRITFDYNVRSRNKDADLSYGDYGDNLLSDGNRIMELKTTSAFPIWLVKILSELKIYPVSFSKYGRVYINIMKNKRGF